MNTAGTFELLLRRLAEALQPLAEELSAGFLHSLGAGIPTPWQSNAQLVGAMQSTRSAAGALPNATNALSAAVAGGDPFEIVAKGIALSSKIAEFITAASQLGQVIGQLAQSDVGLTPQQKTYLQDFAGQFIPRFLETMTVRLLEEKLPDFFAALELVGFAEKNLIVAGSAGAVSPPHLSRSLYLDRLVDLFDSPLEYLEKLTAWGKASFDGSLIYTRLKKLAEALDIPAEIITPAGQPPIFEAFLVGLQVNNAFNPPALGFELRFPGAQVVENTYDLGAPWSLSVRFEGEFVGGVRGVIEPLDGKLTLQPPSGVLNMTVGSDLIARYPNRPMLLVGLPGGTRLEAKSVAFGFGVQAKWNATNGNAAATPFVTAEIEEAKLTLDFRGGDGFLTSVIPLEAIEATFSLKAQFAAGGVRIDGSGGLELAFPTHISLGPLDIQRVYFLTKLFSPTPLGLELSSALHLNLGPLAASVDRIGANIAFEFPADGKGNLGPLNFKLGFKPPNGVGLSIDAGVVSGGGYLFFDFDREEYAGVLQLSISGFVSISAIALITTRMPDGTKGFSLLVIMSVEFSPGIQLGFGFTFLGIGGLLGLNRTVRLETLAQGIRTGILNDIMFPQGDIIANAPRIISDLRDIFPPQEGIFLVGPMVKLGWGTPTLVSVSVGVIIEIPGNFAIVGVLKVAIPTVQAPLIIIQVAFIGAVEFDKERLWFFASMFDSRVVFVTLEGEMGLLVGWGVEANFVVSVGGFNPRFNPPPLPFPNPRRIAIDVYRTPVSLIRLEGYFAVTSNTVQLGARVEIRLGFDSIGIKGHFGFDALFQFSPFYFILEISASVSLQVFGIGLFSIRLQFSLEGPAPYRAKGVGKLKLLFFTVSANFDITWGEKKDTLLPPIAVLPLLKSEIEKIENWKAELPAANNLGVSLRSLDESPELLVLHPLGFLRFSQRLVPLDLNIDKLGNQKPSDANRFELVVASSGIQKKSTSQERFAIAQFQEMKDAEKLSRPAFENQHSGLELSVSGQQARLSRMARRTVRYEEIIIDTNFERFVRRLRGIFGLLFDHLLHGAAVTKLSVSHAYQKKVKPFGDEVVKVDGDKYTVAFTDTNRPFNTGAMSFDSEALARDFMVEMVAETPALGAALHVIPQFEANLN
jgi:hypothetical protein